MYVSDLLTLNSSYVLPRSWWHTWLARLCSMLLLLCTLALFISKAHITLPLIAPLPPLSNSRQPLQLQLLPLQSQTIHESVKAKMQAPLPRAVSSFAQRHAIKTSKKNGVSTITMPPTSVTRDTPTTLTSEKTISFDDAASSSQEPTNHYRDRLLQDKDGIKIAYEASQSDIQKMAKKRGMTLSPHQDPSEETQKKLNKATKPDCLRQGASIFSIFTVAAQVAMDKCK